MNRVVTSVALVSSLVAGCVAEDPSGRPAPDTSASSLSSSQASLSAGAIVVSSALYPTPWTSSITATPQYWAGDGTTNPAKVMNIVYVPTKVDPATGSPAAYYAWLLAGYPCGATCAGTNHVFRVYEVASGDLTSFRSFARLNFDLHEASSGPGVWDGGTGGPLTGTPVHPVGPGGFPGDLVAAMQDVSQSIRTLYTNTVATNAHYLNGGVLTGELP